MTTTTSNQTGHEVSLTVEQQAIGTLQHNLSLAINTHVLKSLFTGHKRGPAGLFKFSAIVRNISDAASQGDLEAKQFLIKLENRIIKVRKEIKAMLKLLKANEIHPKGIIIDEPASVKPAIARLQFSSEYAYLAAFMLAECDELIQILVRQAEVGFSPRKELGEMVSVIRRQVRQVLSMPLQLAAAIKK